MDLLRERQRRELHLARLRIRNGDLATTDPCTAAGGCCSTHSVYSSGGSPRESINIPHQASSIHTGPGTLLPSSVSLPSSPLQTNLAGQHDRVVHLDAVSCFFCFYGSCMSWDTIFFLKRTLFSWPDQVMHIHCRDAEFATWQLI